MIINYIIIQDVILNDNYCVLFNLGKIGHISQNYFQVTHNVAFHIFNIESESVKNRCLRRATMVST